MRTRRLCLWLILAACLPTLVGCQKIEARMKLKEGNRYYLNEDFKHALEEYQVGLKQDPSATFAWRSVGLSAVALIRPGVRSPEIDKYVDTALEAFKKYL